MRQAIPIDFLITAAGLPRQLLGPEVNSFDVQPLLAVEAGVKLAPYAVLSLDHWLLLS